MRKLKHRGRESLAQSQGGVIVVQPPQSGFSCEPHLAFSSCGLWGCALASLSPLVLASLPGDCEENDMVVPGIFLGSTALLTHHNGSLCHCPWPSTRSPTQAGPLRSPNVMSKFLTINRIFKQRSHGNIFLNPASCWGAALNY